jgi:hypothetical protein
MLVITHGSSTLGCNRRKCSSPGDATLSFGIGHETRVGSLPGSEGVVRLAGDPTLERPAMSIVVRFPPSNVSKQQYDSVRAALEESGEWPAEGCQLHVVFGDEEDIRVSEIWESQEQLQAFGEKLRPRMEEAGIRLSGEPEVFEAHIFETF